MARPSRNKRTQRCNAARARAKLTREKRNCRQVAAPHFVSSVELLNHQQIASLLFDRNGCLKVDEFKSDFKKIEPITFTELLDKVGGADDIRYQVEIAKGKLFTLILDLVDQDTRKMFRKAEVDTIKILIGGSRDQVIHKDLGFKEHIKQETQQAIEEKAFSMLIACDPAYPVRLNVLPASLESDETCSLESDEAKKKVNEELINSNKRARLTQHETDKRIVVLQGGSLVFPGGMFHSGAPCLGAFAGYEGCSQFSSPFASLKMIVDEKKKIAEAHKKENEGNKKPKKCPEGKLAVSDLRGIHRLDSISRVFIATWPLGYDQRSTYVDPRDVTCLYSDCGVR